MKTHLQMSISQYALQYKILESMHDSVQFRATHTYTNTNIL
jgi:hypothetical protein